ncbi:MAG: BREX system serine/threonine kinase PglW [Planctomycetes bacterium]|jgi:serine/threonine protein kinase|nr:BREX system serine/threonine kinase PglW [Planctomycetota bacterium]
MKPDSPRFNAFAHTPHPWEQEALNFLREKLLDVEPNRIWALFEFVSPDGNIGEVDALVLTQKGFFLVEIKSRPGRLTGDANTWTWHSDSGKRQTSDSPILVTNRKCKRLISLLRRQKALREHDPDRLFLDPLVFLSASEVQVELDDTARRFVCTREGSPRTQSLLHALTQPGPNDGRRRVIDAPLARAITMALAQAGIRESESHKRFANTYLLDKLLLEGPGYQDWLAHHTAAERVQRRIRIYPVAATSDAPQRQILARAARREFTSLQGVQHAGILQALEFLEGEQGPGLVFDYSPEDTRLDLFLRDEGDKLTTGDRLSILRQIAEALQHTHELHLVHRGLSPQSVLVRRQPKGGCRVRLYNWQTAARDATTGAPLASSSLTLTQHLESLRDPASIPFLAPETANDPTNRAEHLDIFGLGSIAWLLFTGRPPAADRGALLERLSRDGALLLSSALDNVASSLVELVRDSTRAKVAERYQTVAEFLRQLDEVENELTRPADEVFENPTAAQVGQRFPGGWLIKNRLGQGSTAVVFAVERDDGKGKERCVLKLALDPDQNATLRAERDVLRGLRHEAIVEHLGEIECDGHLGLLLASAGDHSLAARIRKQGLELEQLQRFGDDLLSALRYLEEKGVFHRDIKPDNLGVVPLGRGDRLHLVLFDFSLAKAPLAQTQVGTRAYLDPMLGQGKRRHYDPAAERFAAAVTLYEMATGRLPKWGDGRTAPELGEDEVDLRDESLFPSAAREPLTAFFARALRRDAAQRFDNIDEMRVAWQQAFAEIGKPGPRPVAADISLQAPIQLLGLSTRAENVLERAGIETVLQLLRVPQGRLTKGRGVGAVTRDELLRSLAELRSRFPEVQPGDELPPRRPRPTEDVAAEDTADEPSATFEQLVERLVPVPRTKTKKDQQPAELLRGLLFADPTTTEPQPWPTQTEVGKQHKTTTVVVHQVLAKARERWQRLAGVTEVRHALFSAVLTQGGITSIAEAVRMIADGFAAGIVESKRDRAARAMLRAAVEAEASLDEPRFEGNRRHDRVWLVVHQDHDGQPLQSSDLLRYAYDLGRRAKELAHAEPLPPPSRVLETLQQVPVPDGLPAISPDRLVRLAATAADVAVSGKLELYPRNMPAERALKLGHGVLLGASELSVQQIRERIHSRYPEAEALPVDVDRLGPLLHQVVPDLQWDAERSTFRFHSAPRPKLTGERTLPARGSSGSLPPLESPEVLEAKEFDERLQKAFAKFLVLSARREEHETVLQRLQARFGERLHVVSCEHELLRRLRAQTDREGIPWDSVLAADGAPPTSPEAKDLRQIVLEAASGLGDELGREPGHGTLVLTRLGMLARYGLLGTVVERLRERAYRSPQAEGALAGVWLLVATSGAQERPTVDGVPVPIPGARSDYVDVPRAWVQLGQRGRAG